MADRIERASEWIYSGIWLALTNLFLVPRGAPTMPAGSHAIIGSFRPAPGSLRYSKLFFWLALLAMDLFFGAVWLGIAIALPIAGAILLLPALIIIIVPDIFAYIAIHLRYDTTWYVLTDRSMRLRSGVLLLNETTITYENIQNVSVEQGPVQRVFGIADVAVQTAGGGGSGHGKHGGSSSLSHLGRIRGIDQADAAHARDMIMTRVRASRSAGLGDEHAHEPHGRRPAGVAAGASGGPQLAAGRHLEALRQIRDVLAGAGA